MIKKIIVSGGWSYGNLGDEVIAMSTIGLLEKAFPTIEKIYTSYDPQDFLAKLDKPAHKSMHALIKDFDNVSNALETYISNPEKYGLGEYCALFDENTLFVMSGGGYFDGAWLSQFAARILEIELALKYGSKVVIMGQSIGPFLNDTQTKWITKSLNKCEYISVRDESSRSLLQKILPDKEINCCCDLAITISDFLQISGKDKRGICNLIVQIYASHVENGITRKRNDKILKRLTLKLYRYNFAWIRLIRLVEKELGLKCRIILNVQATSQITNSHFEKYANQLKKFSGCKDMEIIKSTSIRAFCEELEKADYIISCKMHPLIISSSYGVPAYAISQHYKIDAFMKWIARDEYCQKNSCFLPKKIVNQIKLEMENKKRNPEIEQRKRDVYAMIDEMRKKCI